MKKKTYSKPDLKSEKIHNKVVTQACDKCPSAVTRTRAVGCRVGISRLY